MKILTFTVHRAADSRVNSGMGPRFKLRREAKVKALRLACTLAAALALSVPAMASLGGKVSSVDQDRAQMNASATVTQTANYDVHEIKSPAGTVVDEYVSLEGNVFAVAWHGPFPPQMQQILGSYYQQYTAAMAAQPQHYGRRPVNIQAPGLTIEMGGHMRDYFGRAYIPDMMPSGVKEDEIK